MSQWLPIADIAQKVQKGELKAADLVQQALRTIEEKKDYQAIVATTAERARQRASDIDQRVKNGEQIGRLAGVPFIAKDNFLTFGSETTAASNILKGFEAPYQAMAIELLEAEGAICVAKANLDAFAHGSSTENSDFFTTLNPHDKSRVPGGSSGGSAAAVILDMAPFALGTDTGGSIRLPASFCGAVGYKPTYGLVSRSGVVAMASSTDVIGPLTRTVNDTALILDILAGKDALDATSIERQPAGYNNPSTELSGTTIGVIKEYMDQDVSPDVKKIINTSMKKLEQKGVKVVIVSLPSLDLALAAYYIIGTAEISSNLSRYDGQRYGFSDDEAKDLETSYTQSRGKGFGREAKRRIMIGTYVLSSGYYDAYYKRAQTVRTKIIQEFASVFERVDFLAGPVAPCTAFAIGEMTKHPLAMYIIDKMTIGVSLVGVPAISIPAGMSKGLPVGLQLIAPQHKDRELLGLAKAGEELLI